MAENNKKDSFNFPPVGGKNNKGPKFGGYWSFIIIAAFIIGIQFFSMPSNPERISWQKFKTDLLAKGEVKDIYIVRNGSKAEITLKPEKVETHSDLVAKGFNQKSVGPQYYVPFGTLEQFEKNLQDAKNTRKKHPTCSLTIKTISTGGEKSLHYSYPSPYSWESGYSSCVA